MAEETGRLHGFSELPLDVRKRIKAILEKCDREGLYLFCPVRPCPHRDPEAISRLYSSILYRKNESKMVTKWSPQRGFSL
jgi:hypothetical protein